MESLKELGRDGLSILLESPVFELFEVRFSSSISKDVSMGVGWLTGGDFFFAFLLRTL